MGSLYLHTGHEDDEVNSAALFQAGGVVRALGLPYVLCADWQMEPDTLASSGWPSAVNGAIVRPDRPTCF